MCLYDSQCAAHDIPIPTVDVIEKKQKDVDEARHYMYKDEDIEKVGVKGQNIFCNDAVVWLVYCVVYCDFYEKIRAYHSSTPEASLATCTF